MSTKARASKAIRLMITDTADKVRCGRTFDDCFEMGDGTAVVQEIVKRSMSDPGIHAAVIRNGCGYWFDDPKYQPIKHPSLF
jgi:hypothetical protein